MEYILIQNLKGDLEYDTLEHIYEEPLDNKYQMVEELNKRDYRETEKKYIALEQFILGKIAFEEVMKVLM